MGEEDQPLTRAPAAQPGRWQHAAGYLLGLAGLVWVFHDVRFRELPGQLAHIGWGWVALAIFCDVLTYLFQGWRWQLLLQPVGRLSAWRATQAVYAGLFTNEVLPMRFGELVRAYLVSRWVRAGFTAVLPSMVVERLLDGLWLAAGMGLAAMFVPLPPDLLKAGDLLGLLVLAGTGFFLYLVVRQERKLETRERPASPRPARLGWMVSFVDRLARGLGEIGFSRPFYLAAAISFAMMALQALAYWLILWAYGLKVSFWVGAAVYLIVHLGTAVPNAPANVGTYQFFTVVGLTLFGVDKTVAAGFSIVVFLLLTIPLWVLGFWALAASGSTLTAIRAEVGRLLENSKRA